MIQQSEQFKTDADGVFQSTGTIIDGNPPLAEVTSMSAQDLQAPDGRWRRIWFPTQPDPTKLPEGVIGWADTLTRQRATDEPAGDSGEPYRELHSLSDIIVDPNDPRLGR